MKAVALKRYLPITDPEALLDVELPDPRPEGHDLLVRVHAVSVNPVDTKVRSPKDKTESPPKVLGWDAAGLVEAVGPEVTLFRPGDAVFYAGSITRPGCDSELHLVDERIVGHKPRSLDFAQAAAMPLTALTAHEALFDRMSIDLGGRHAGRSLLIINGAGGVGSIAIQLAKLAGLQVIATASRPESQAWCRTMGADHVINHREDLAAQLRSVGSPEVDYIFNTVNTAAYWTVMGDVIKPFGRMASIVETKEPLDLGRLMRKSVELLVGADVHPRHLPDAGHARAAPHPRAGVRVAGRRAPAHDARPRSCTPISAANLRAAHAKLESGTMVGKLALEGWR